jgi:molecular chaperone GrpE
MTDERDESAGSAKAAVSEAPPERAEVPAAEESAQADLSAEASAKADPQAELRRETAALQDRLLRTAAEFDNYRKRIERERRDQADAAAAAALEDLLPIIDNLERALQAPAGADVDGYRKGVELVHQQMVELLRRRGVKPIQSVGTDFDPRFHEAVVHEASADHREGEVIEEMRRGYMLGERLLRPAMVKVAKA